MKTSSTGTAQLLVQATTAPDIDVFHKCTGMNFFKEIRQNYQRDLILTDFDSLEAP